MRAISLYEANVVSGGMAGGGYGPGGVPLFEADITIRLPPIEVTASTREELFAGLVTGFEATVDFAVYLTRLTATGIGEIFRQAGEDLNSFLNRAAGFFAQGNGSVTCYAGGVPYTPPCR